MSTISLAASLPGNGDVKCALTETGLLPASGSGSSRHGSTFGTNLTRQFGWQTIDSRPVTGSQIFIGTVPAGPGTSHTASTRSMSPQLHPVVWRLSAVVKT